MDTSFKALLEWMKEAENHRFAKLEEKLSTIQGVKTASSRNQPPRPRQQSQAQRNFSKQAQNLKPISNKPRDQLISLPEPLSVMFRRLREMGLVSGRPATYTPETCKDFRPDQFCEYHQGAAGHSTDNCNTLRRRIQWLVDHGELVFRTPGEAPNIDRNPLPRHQGDNSVNVVESDGMDFVPLPLHIYAQRLVSSSWTSKELEHSVNMVQSNSKA